VSIGIASFANELYGLIKQYRVDASLVRLNIGIRNQCIRKEINASVMRSLVITAVLYCVFVSRWKVCPMCKMYDQWVVISSESF
jgi:hypothetical protein